MIVIITKLICIKIFALFGRNFPNELPTKLQVAYPNPRGMTNPRNKMFLNIMY